MSTDLLGTKIQRFLADLKEKEKRVNRDNDAFAWEFLKIRIDSDEFRETSEFSTEIGSRPVNLKKNRYRDILPFDSCRVKLTPYADDNDSDYINASFIKGANGQNAYIATQGPMVDTLKEFWQMIAENNSKTILMLCDLEEGGKSKCEKYWPDLGATKEFGQILVANNSEKQPQAHYTERKLSLNYDGKVRDVTHFHYHGWPDHGTPDEIEPLLEFIDAVRNWQKETESQPILVHCSAGCGRSGTFCALDFVRTQLKTKLIPNDFDVRSLVMDLRKQRPAMVQSKDQYILLHRAIAQMFQHYLQTLMIENGDKQPVPPPRKRKGVIKSESSNSVPDSEDQYSLNKNASTSSVFTESLKSSPERSPKHEEKEDRVFHLNESISKLLPSEADDQAPSVFSRLKAIAEYKTPKDDLDIKLGNNKTSANLVRHGSSVADSRRVPENFTDGSKSASVSTYSENDHNYNLTSVAGLPSLNDSTISGGTLNGAAVELDRCSSEHPDGTLNGLNETQNGYERTVEHL